MKSTKLNIYDKPRKPVVPMTYLEAQRRRTDPTIGMDNEMQVALGELNGQLKSLLLRFRQYSVDKKPVLDKYLGTLSKDSLIEHSNTLLTLTQLYKDTANLSKELSGHDFKMMKQDDRTSVLLEITSKLAELSEKSTPTTINAGIELQNLLETEMTIRDDEVTEPKKGESNGI